MSRAIVHKTKGKLDLRALTVFGMNAKPATTAPIGYFGTGLKYAVAVLVRHNIPVTLWIDRKRWTVEKVGTQFRDKGFEALYLMRHTLIPKTINLPFTTELGKNWELWQAFRELESNTRDELGETFIQDDNMFDSRNQTIVVVRDERYVQCWMERDKTFLPEGLQIRPDSDTRVQAFARKSQHVYYRGIRIHDLKEPSENTYNILSALTLTEDRTCKYTWEVTNAIENFLQETANEDVAFRAIKAPPQSYESRFNYDYVTISDRFLNWGRSAGTAATEAVKSKVRDHTPKIRETYTNWIRAIAGAIERGDYDAVEEIAAGEHKEELLNILRKAATEYETEEHNNSQSAQTSEPIRVNIPKREDSFEDPPF